jgi:bacterial/archaeal transporter family protein
MDKMNWVLALLSMVAWAIGSLLAKLATNRIGEKAVMWDMVGYVPGIIIFGLILFKNQDVVHVEKWGLTLAMLAGFVGSLGALFFYILLSKRDASVAVPITALYPALTAILAFIFLREQLTAIKVVGIVMSAVAMVLLSL